MKLVESDRIDALSALDTKASSYVRGWQTATDAELIRNVDTRMLLLDTGSQHFPVSLNSGKEGAENCYVVSPMTTYVGYANEEIRRLHRPWLEWPLARLVGGMGRLLESAEVDRIVHINNWLLSTNLYPDNWRGDDVSSITEFMVATYPEHAIAFRSLNQHSNQILLGRFRSQGYLPIPSRQVYLFDGTRGDQSRILRHHNTSVDYTLLRRSSYQIVNGDDLSGGDFLQLEKLYGQLYLEKYCLLNPQYTAEWLQRGHRDGWLEIRALRTEEGRIDGTLGWFSNERILTAPIVGYDTTLPQRVGLYRMLTRMCLQEAVERRCLLNFSSGAAHFKRMRGGEPEIEYSMVYTRHLSNRQRRVWKLLSHLLQGIGVPIMRTLKL